jgi:hypothetical protein
MVQTKQNGDASPSESAVKDNAPIDGKPTKEDVDASSGPAANHSSSTDMEQASDASSLEPTAKHSTPATMEPRLAAASSNTSADLRAALEAMRLVETSSDSSPRQEHLISDPNHDLDAIIEAIQISDDSSSSLKPQDTQQGLQMLPKPRLYDEGESSSHVCSPGGGGDPHYGELALPFTAAGLSYPSVAPIRSKLRATAVPFYRSQHQPSARYPHPGAATGFLTTRLYTPALHEFRTNLLRATDGMVYALILRFAEPVFHLLTTGDDEVRLRLFSLIAVSHGMWRAYDMMKSRDMYAVFVALLRACEERHDATRLCIIAQVVASSNGAGFLMAASDTQYGYVHRFKFAPSVYDLATCCGLL